MPSVATPPLYAGTSGFAYPSWKPDFYPAKLASANFLSYYATRLNLVEVNYTYRRIASASTFAKWIAGTPEAFRFSPKAHMKITHSLKLNNAEDFTRFFLESLEPLRQAGRLAPILFQLAPSFSKRTESASAPSFPSCPSRIATRLSSGMPVGSMSRSMRRCVRTMWHFASAKNEKLETPEVVTADFVYLRLRKEDYSEGKRHNWRFK